MKNLIVYIMMTSLLGAMNFVQAQDDEKKSKLRVAMFQDAPIPGNVPRNVERLKATYLEAVKSKMDLIVTSELYLTGYGLRDHFNRYEILIKSTEAGINEILELSKNYETAILVGHIQRNMGHGKPLQNVVSLIHRGKIVHQRIKSLLPTYGVFEDYRYFEPGLEEAKTFRFKGVNLGILICEEGWADLKRPDGKRLYQRNPVEELSKQNPDLGIVISSSPFGIGKAEGRDNLHRNIAIKWDSPLIWVNEVRPYDNVIPDGRSVVFDSKGNVITRLNAFEADYAEVEVAQDVKLISRHGNSTVAELPKEELVLKAMISAVRSYAELTGIRKAVLGLSGGIDSTLSAAVLVEALGRENVYGYAMPGIYSSQKSETLARELAKNLGIPAKNFDVISIREETQSLLEKNPHWRGTISEENLQADLRGTVLLRMSNSIPGSQVFFNGNRDEMLQGYYTLGGDNEGGMGLLGDLYKQEVYRLVRYINQTRDTKIPMGIVERAPTAELSEGQLDSDLLPRYELLDLLLDDYTTRLYDRDRLARKYTLADPKRAKADPMWVYNVIRKLWHTEFKRRQSGIVLSLRENSLDMNAWRHLIATGGFETDIPAKESNYQIGRSTFLNQLTQNSIEEEIHFELQTKATDQLEIGVLGDVEGNWKRVESFVRNSEILYFDQNGRVRLKEGKKFVFMGDAIDHGSDSLRILETLIDLKETYGDRVVLLMGNRDINKLRLIQELTEEALRSLPKERFENTQPYIEWVSKQKAWHESDVSDPVLRLQWILEQTMGASKAFEARRTELLKRTGHTSISDSEVVESLLSDVEPNGILSRYLRMSQLIHFDRSTKTVFVHGGLNNQSLGAIPGRSKRYPQIEDWGEELNRWAHVQVLRGLSGIGNGADDLISYQEPESKGKNPHSVIYSRLSDSKGDLTLPGARTQDRLISAGYQRLAIGHTPTGEVPVISRHHRKGNSFEVIATDVSFNQTQESPVIVLNQDELRVFANLKDSEPLDYRIRLNEASPIGKRTKDNRTVIGQTSSGKYLLMRSLPKWQKQYDGLHFNECELLFQ